VSFKRGWIGLLLFSLSMINYTDRVALSVAAQSVSREFHLSPVAMGYLLSAFVWSYALFLIPMGLAIDRYGTKRVATAGIVTWSAATAFVGTAWSYPSIFIALLVLGVGESSSNPVGGKVIREWIPASERGVFNAIFNSGSYAGPAFGSALVAVLIHLLGWRVSFFLAGGLGFVWLAAWLKWFGSPEKVQWLGDDERQKILEEREVRGSSATTQGESHSLVTLLSQMTMWGLALTQGCNVYSQYLFLSWLPSYLQTTRHLSILKTGFLSVVPYGCAVGLCIFCGRLSDVYLKKRGVAGGRRRNLVAASMIVASGLLVAPFIGRIWLLVVLFTISLTGIATTTSLNFALLSDLLPNPRDLGKAMGCLVVGGNLFGLLAPIVTGYVISATGSYNWAFIVAGILLVCGATITLTMTRQPMEFPACRLARTALGIEPGASV
jgi:ACS family glucarate transporter-like MFS transporter